MFTDKSWIDGGGLEPRAVTRDLDWGIDVPVEGAKGKNYTCGLMPLLDISRLQKNGRYVKEKWNRTGKIKTQAGSFYRKQYVFFTALFSCDVKSRRKLYFTRQCACK
jgi:methionyl-tRNA synthetase